MLFWALWATLFPIALGLSVAFAMLDEAMSLSLDLGRVVKDIATKA